MTMRGTTWRNWSGLVEGTPASRIAPRSEAEIQEAVRRSSEAGRGIAVAGSGHSFARLVDPDNRTLLSLEHYTGIESVNLAGRTVTVRGGTVLRELNDNLARLGLALPNQTAIAEQTIAGLVATASHGSSLRYGSLSTHVVGARLVMADGTIRSVSSANPELDAVRTHLGCLGVVSALTLRVVPAFCLRRTAEPGTLPGVLDDLAALQARDFGGFWWFPHTAKTLSWWAEYTDHPPYYYEPAPRLRPPQRLLRASMARPAVASRVNSVIATMAGADRLRTARSDLVLLQHLAPRQQVLEYGVPNECAADAVTELARLVKARRLRVAAPVEVRFTGPDTAWLSPASERATCYVNVAAYLSRGRPAGWEPAMREIDALFAGYEGRSHWAKVQYRTADQLAAAYPRWSDFQAVRRAWDPGDVFCGGHLREMFGVLSAA